MRWLLILCLSAIAFGQLPPTPNLGLTNPAPRAQYSNDWYHNFAVIDNIFLAATCSDSLHVTGWDSLNKKLTCIALTAAAGNAALKPSVAMGIQYVATSGNDSNDGLSWGTAKLTVDAAILALPGAVASPATQGNGTVYVTDGVYWNSNHACGFWRMAASDPNYASPPTCWMRTNSGLSIVCAATQANPGNAHFPACTINGGSTADSTHPGIWLSSSSTATSFYGISLTYNGNPVKLGICSDLSRGTSCGVQNILFEHFSDAMGNALSNVGPGVDIAGQSFWIYFRDYQLSGNGNAAVTADNAPAVLIDGRGNNGSGLIHFEDGVMSSGGIKVYGGSNAGAVYVTNLDTENIIQASVWIASNGGGVTAKLDHIETSDCSTSGGAGCYALENDGAPAGNISAIEVLGTSLGAYTCAGVCPVSGASLPSVNGQVGNIAGHLYGQSDVSRRMFSPVAVRSANLATIVPGSWGTSACASCTVTTVSAPDGTSNAGQVSTVAGGQQFITFYSATTSISVGDVFLIGVWAQSQTNNGFNNGIPAKFVLNDSGFGSGDQCSTGLQSVSMSQYATKGWAWYSAICTISAAPNSPGLAFSGIIDSTHTAQFYAPIIIKFPSGTLSTNEAYEYLAALSSYPPGATVGTKVTLAGTSDVILSTPASSSAACLAGQMWADTGFVYVCTATNTIKRVALSPF